MVVARIIDEAKLLTFCFGYDKIDNTEYQNIDIISLSIAYFSIPQDTSHVTVVRTPSVLHVL